MTDNGGQLLAATRAVRKHFEDIGQLLSTAEGMLKKHGWIAKGNVASAGGSTSIIHPDYWMPQDVFRFMGNKKHLNIMAVVSVIIDDLNDMDAISEPLVSAAWFDYGKGQEVGSKWSYNFSRVVLSSENYSTDGKMNDVPVDVLNEAGSWHIYKSKALAYPLTKITSAKELEGEIVVPFTDSVNEHLDI